MADKNRTEPRGITPQFAGDLSSAGYIFSTQQSVDEFRANDSNHQASAAIEHMKGKRTGNALAAKVKMARAMETSKAMSILETIGGRGNLSARDALMLRLKEGFYKNMSEETKNVNLETMLYRLVKKDIDDLSQKNLLNIEKGLMLNAGERSRKAKATVSALNDIFIKIAGASLSNDDANVYHNMQNLLILIRNNGIGLAENDVNYIIQMAKGSLQEIYSYANFAAGLEDAKVELVGALKGDLTPLIENFIAGKIQSQSSEGTVMSGDKKYFDSDIMITLGGKKLGVSVKTTVDITKDNKNRKGSELYRISRKIEGTDLSIKTVYQKADPEIKSYLNYAKVLIMSSFLVSNNSRLSQDKILRPLSFIVANSKSFLDGLAPKSDLENENFNFILNVNNNLFWFSDLLQTLLEDIENFNSTLYKQFLSFGAMPSLNTNNKTMLNVKRMIVRKTPELTYTTRLQSMLDNDYLKKQFKDADKAFKSISVRVNTDKLRIHDRRSI